MILSVSASDRGRRGFGANLLLMTAALSVFLVTLEIGVRLVLGDMVDTEALQEALDQTSIRQIIQPSGNRELFYELRPNLSTRFRESIVHTSEEGYRIAAVEADLPEDRIRVALLGDSTPFGYRVDYEDTYGERFRLRMEAATGRSIELRNYAVPGYNAKQELKIFLDHATRYRPHLVILHNDHNDAQETGFGYPPGYLTPTYGNNPLRSALLKLVIRRGRILQNRLTAMRDDRGHEYFEGYIVRGPLYEEFLGSRAELAAELQRQGIPGIAVLFNAFVKSDGDSEEYRQLHRKLDDAFTAMGFHVLDLYPAYQEILAREGWTDLSEWWVAKEPIDGHPNPEGHAFIAETLAEFVLSRPELAGVFGAAPDDE